MEEGYMGKNSVTGVEKGGWSGKGLARRSVTRLSLDPSFGCDALTFQLCSVRSLSGLNVLGGVIKGIFPITERLPS